MSSSRASTLRIGLVTGVFLVVAMSVGPLVSGLGVASADRALAGGRVWHVVVLGDSGASGNGDPTGLAWGGRYGQLLRRKLGLSVVVTNLAREGKSSIALRGDLRSDPTTRSAVENADIILFGSTAGANLNAADARLQARQCAGTACYAAALRSWSRDYREIVAAAVALRGRKTVLRGVADPNVVPGAQNAIPPFATVRLGLFQAQAIRRTVCETMKAHGGRCVDVLTAFNGPRGTQDAYKSGLMNKVECCYPSGKGQQLIAEMLLKAGLAPLR
jgi:hypothetical protein